MNGVQRRMISVDNFFCIFEIIIFCFVVAIWPSLRVTKRVNKFCFGAIYNGRLWEKELRVSALKRNPCLAYFSTKCKYLSTFPRTGTPFKSLYEKSARARATCNLTPY